MKSLNIFAAIVLLFGIAIVVVAYLYGSSKDKKNRMRFESWHKYQGLLIIGIGFVAVGILGLIAINSLKI